MPVSMGHGATSIACGAWCTPRCCHSPPREQRCRLPSARMPKNCTSNVIRPLPQFPRIWKVSAFRTKAVARVRELSNSIADLPTKQDGAAWVLRFGLETVARLITLMMPHLAEELWKTLGNTTLLAQTLWPEFDPALLSEDSVTVAVQINGKLRTTIGVAQRHGCQSRRGSRPGCSVSCFRPSWKNYS